MDIGILTTRNHQYHPNRRFIEAALNMGHRPLLIDVGGFRSNIHLKGVGDRIELSDAHTYGAVQSAEVLELDVAGVGMLESKAGPMVLEVNYSPGFRELEKVVRMDIAESILN